MFDLISYSMTSGPDGGGENWNYWCDRFLPSDAAAETSEFAELTHYLMANFSGSGKTFIFEHWEGE